MEDNVVHLGSTGGWEFGWYSWISEEQNCYQLHPSIMSYNCGQTLVLCQLLLSCYKLFVIAWEAICKCSSAWPFYPPETCLTVSKICIDTPELASGLFRSRPNHATKCSKTFLSPLSLQRPWAPVWGELAGTLWRQWASERSPGYIAWIGNMLASIAAISREPRLSDAGFAFTIDGGLCSW